MSTLNPTLGSSVSFEQPVPQQPVASSLLDVAASFIGSASAAPRQPSAAERQNNVLQPFSNQLDEWRYESNMTDAQFTRNARRAASTFIAANPEYEGEVMSILGAYGVAEEPVTSTPEDAITTSFNNWLETPEGNSALVSNVVIGDNGQIDEEATLNAAERQFYEDNALQTEITRTNRELELAKGNMDLRNTRATQAVDDRFFPRWATQSQTSVTTMMRLATSGSANLDSMDEQLAYVRRSRLEAETRFRDQAIAAGIPQEIYEPKVQAALAPYDSTIDFIESSAGDLETSLNAMRTAQQYGAEQKMIESLGVFAAIPAFRDSAMTQLGMTFASGPQFERVLEGLEADAQRLQENGGSTTNFNPFSSNYTYATPEELANAAANGESAVDTTRVDELFQRSQEDSSFLPNLITDNATLMGTDTGNPADVKLQMANISEAAEATSAPLGSSILRNVFNSANVSRLQSVIQQGGAVGADVEAQVTYFVAKQIDRNLSIVTTNLTQLNQMSERMVNEPFSGGVGARQASLELINGRNVLVETDVASGQRTVIMSENDIKGNDEFSRQLRTAFTAVTNINTLSNVHRRVTGTDIIEYGPQTRPVTGRGFPPQRPSDEMSVESITPRGSFSQKAIAGGQDKPVTEASSTRKAEAENFQGDALSLLRDFEGFRESPYWDVNAYRVGYGSDTITRPDGTVVQVEEGMTVTREDAERDLARRAQEFATIAKRQVGSDVWTSMPTNVTAALTSIAYNYGSLPERILDAARSGDTEALADAVEGLAEDNNGVNRDRRMREAAIIRGEPTPPTAAPLFTNRPQGRPETPAVAPGDAPEGGTQRTQQTATPTAVTESLRPVSREDGIRGKSASQATSEESAKRIQGQDIKLLQLLGRKAEDLPNFESQESLQDSVNNGEVKEGDVVMLEGRVYVV